MHLRVLPAVFTVTLLLAGCADFGEPIDGHKRLSPTEVRLQAAETKLADVSKRLDAFNQVFEDNGGGRLNDDLRSLRGDVEKLRFDLDSMEKRNRDLYQDLDRRLQRLEGSSPATGSLPPVAPPPSYWMGEAHYVKRDYPAAIQSFQTVAERFPKSPKAPDALLKLGLAQSESKQKDQSRATLQRLVKDYPSSNAANLARQRLSQP